MKKLSFRPTACILCGSTKKNDYEVLFPANFSNQKIAELFSARRLPDGIHYQIVKCKKDGQVRSNPVLDEKTLAHFYKESQFTYQHELTNLVDTYLRAINNVLPHLKKTDRILEVGCGSGFVLAALHRLGFRRLAGAEPSKAAVEAADKSVKKNIIQKPFSVKLFPPKSFRFIFFLQTLDHISNPEQFLKNCRTLLTPGGYILSYHHNVESWSAKMLGERSPIFDIEHTYLYSHETTQKLFEKCGFEVVKVYSPVNTISLYHLLWLTPLPLTLKKEVLKENAFLQKLRVPVPLGNTCVVARKPY